MQKIFFNAVSMATMSILLLLVYNVSPKQRHHLIFLSKLSMYLNGQYLKSWGIMSATSWYMNDFHRYKGCRTVRCSVHPPLPLKITKAVQGNWSAGFLLQQVVSNIIFKHHWKASYVYLWENLLWWSKHVHNLSTAWFPWQP